MSRSQAIADLRRELLKFVDQEHSLCLVAAQRGIFCNGFGRWSTAELERRLPCRTPAEGEPKRADVVRRANHWLSGLQDVHAGRLPCDVLQDHRSLCAGWEEFFESELAIYYREMCGEDVRVVPDALLEPPGTASDSP